MATGCATLDPVVIPGPMAGPLAAAATPAPTSPAWAIAGVGPGAGVRGAWVEPEIAHADVAGVEAPEHDGQWFERIHLIPRSTSLGYLAADAEVAVVVWNAWRRGRALTAINVTGPAGVSAPALSLPQHFATLQSREHVVSVSVLGEPEIDNLLVWDFADLPDAGTTLTLTGWRVQLFVQHPNGEVGELYGYLTRLFRAHDGTEQRCLLRTRPGREVRIRTTATTMDRLQALVAQLHSGGHYLSGVPLWMDSTRTTSYVGVGALQVPLSTTGRAFVEGAMCLLYQDPENWEVGSIESVEAAHLHLVTPTARGWAADTLCVPVLPGRLLDTPELQRPCGGVAEVEVAFSLEPQTSVAAPDSGALYGTQLDGIDVLTEAQHNARDEIRESFARVGALLDNPTGKREYDDHGGRAFPARNFLWTAPDRAACVRLREFLDARKGRLVPFWTPTFSWDLELAEDSPAESATLVIRRAGYGQFLWPVPARRRLAIFVPGQPMALRKVISLETGTTTETLHLDSAPGGTTLFAETTRICFLPLCRLAEDLTEITWSHTDHCEARIQFAEIPHEVPA
jgi:hypothetical protein